MLLITNSFPFTGSKNLTMSDMASVLEKMRDHLITKNVASDIAIKLCDSVATKLEGKVLGIVRFIDNLFIYLSLPGD